MASLGLRGFVLGAFAVMSTAGAQPFTACELMQQRLTARTGDPKLCMALYQSCTEQASSAPNVQDATNQCSAQLGGCQMGGALSGESLQEATKQYKKQCGEAITPRHVASRPAP